MGKGSFCTRWIQGIGVPDYGSVTKSYEGWIDWGFESDFVAVDLSDLPLVSPKPILDQDYFERKNAKMWFSARMGVSLVMPHPVAIDQESYAGVKLNDSVPYPITARYWVDGEEKVLNRNSGDRGPFSLPVKFATSGIHSIKVEIIDADGKKRTRLIKFPVAFNFTTEIKTKSNLVDLTIVKVKIRGSDGPFVAHFATNDGQKIEQTRNYMLLENVTGIRQKIPNPGMDTVKWIDVVIKDTKVGYVVSKRIKLGDEAVVASLTADKTELALDEKVTLSVDIQGGERSFVLYPNVNGERRSYIVPKVRKGTFSLSFDKPGTYKVYVDVRSRNIAKEIMFTPSQTITLIVGEPEEESAQGFAEFV